MIPPEIQSTRAHGNEAQKQEKKSDEIQIKDTSRKESSCAGSLFRKEVLNAKRNTYFGRVLIITPISYSVWMFGIFFIVIAMGLFFYFGEYSSSKKVFGALVPDKGLITIYAKNRGVVVKKFIEQGEEVTKGQLICLISTEQEAASVLSLSAERITILEKQIALQKNQIAMFEKRAADYERLLKQHFISEVEYQKRQAEYLAAKLTLYNFEKELTQAKEYTDYAIRSPINGTISVLIANVGDRVTEDGALASIIPKDAKLEGQLFVPTSKAGFVRPGQKVLISYHAYPYQRFGLYEATVRLVDKSIINSQDLKTVAFPIKLDEAIYRVIVTLQKQTINIYGKPYPLLAGMLFDAVIVGEKRRIWQWIMDPIYSLKGS